MFFLPCLVEEASDRGASSQGQPIIADLKNTGKKALSITNEDERLLFFSKLESLKLAFLESYTISAKEITEVQLIFQAYGGPGVSMFCLKHSVTRKM